MIFSEKFHRVFSFLCLRTAAVCVPPGSGSRLISFGMMWIIRRDHWVIMQLKFFHPPNSSHQSIEPNDSSLTSAEALQMCQSSRSRQGIVILWKVHPHPFWPKCVEPAISTQFVHLFCALNLKQLTRSPKSSRSLCHLWHTHIIHATTYNLWCLYTRAVCSTSSSQNRERNPPRHVFGGPSLSSCYAIDVFCEPGRGEARAETSSAKMAGVDT